MITAKPNLTPGNVISAIGIAASFVTAHIGAIGDLVPHWAPVIAQIAGLIGLFSHSIVLHDSGSSTTTGQ